MLLSLRLATFDDAEILFAWRNDPETRAASHNTSEVNFPSHCEWLRRSLEMDTRTIYIVEADGTPVGTVRKDRGNEFTELSWTVAPEHRRNGIGKRMLAMIVNASTGKLRAEVKRTNLASIAIANKAGLKLEREDGDILHFST